MVPVIGVKDVGHDSVPVGSATIFSPGFFCMAACAALLTMYGCSL
jgi:hypothetical protein